VFLLLFLTRLLVLIRQVIRLSQLA